MLWTLQESFLFFVLLITVSSSIHIYEDHTNHLDESRNASVVCPCQDIANVTPIKLNLINAGEFYSDLVQGNNNFSEDIKNHSVLRELKESCKWHQFHLKNCCRSICAAKTYLRAEAENSEIVIKGKMKNFSKVIHIPIGGYHNSRQSRQVHVCPVPTSLKSAEINCHVFPGSKKCKQRCAFGYTLKNGIQQSMKCTFKENIWRPFHFKECKPFIDCTLSLILPGIRKCTTPSIHKGYECAVECFHFEDKSAIHMKNHTCQIDGTWDPPLPFCVTPGSGLALAEAPEIKLHEQ